MLSSVKDGDGNTIVVPVYINEMGSYNRVFMQTNKIASVYGKSGLSDYIKREVAKGNLVRIKKRSPANSESPAPIAVDYNGVTSQAKAADQTAMAFGNISIRPASENVNTKIKKSERDVDLTAKYPQLNLNEDISELDGVPAIELTDGSVLPITERDGRYPTHVSFIEANRIDVDDLKSGGWIGNGVYDPSFTSDTQRYIERQQAKRRVAELTGKEYRQFSDTKYSLREYSDRQIENRKDSKRTVVYDNDMQLLDFIRDARAGKIGNKKIYYCIEFIHWLAFLVLRKASQCACYLLFTLQQSEYEQRAHDRNHAANSADYAVYFSGLRIILFPR